MNAKNWADTISNLKEFATKKGWHFISITDEYYFFFSWRCAVQFLDDNGELKQFIFNNKGKIVFETVAPKKGLSYDP